MAQTSTSGSGRSGGQGRKPAAGAGGNPKAPAPDMGRGGRGGKSGYGKPPAPRHFAAQGDERRPAGSRAPRPEGEAATGRGEPRIRQAEGAAPRMPRQNQGGYATDDRRPPAGRGAGRDEGNRAPRGEPRTRDGEQSRTGGRSPAGLDRAGNRDRSSFAGQGFGNIEQRQRQRGDNQGGEFRDNGGPRTPRGRAIVAADLPVERAKKMVTRRGSEKQEMFAQQLREKRVDARFVGELRIQKALALTGVGSRRDCDEWVSQGRVSINGARAQPGARVRQGDRVLFDGKAINIKWPDRLPRIVVYHKQEGELVSRDDPEGRTTVFDRLPKVQSSAWVAVGRLDFNTSGLLIFTTSGDLANRMMHPSFEVEREYAVRVLGSLTEEQKQQLLTGVQLDDGEAHFDVLQDQGGEGQNHWYRVILREGRNREVRRMFEHFELQVSRLMRVRFGSLTLPSRLKRGQYYELEEPEVLAVLKWAGLGLTGRTPTR
jgi:23S rRNA pseudouridine2605 synthase